MALSRFRPANIFAKLLLIIANHIQRIYHCLLPACIQKQTRWQTYVPIV